MDWLKSYLQESGRKRKRLKRSEICELLKKYKYDNDREAYHTLIQAFLPYVNKIAFKYYRRLASGLDIMDLIQSGSLGLLKALELLKNMNSYDDVIFSLFIKRYISAFILVYIVSEACILSYPVSSYKDVGLFFSLKKISADGVDLKEVIQELSDKFSFSEAKIEALFDLLDVSFDKETDNLVYEDQRDLEEDVDRKMIIERVQSEDCLRNLTEMERIVLKEHFLKGKSLSEIGLNISRVRFKQIKDSIIKKLRQYFKVEV